MRCNDLRSVIYLDNAASTHPKPHAVYAAVNSWLRSNGANAGRSGHRLSVDATEMIFSARVAVGELFSAQPESVVFCNNATHALNTAIMGLCPKGKRILISDMEHNSVYRPVYMLRKWGLCEFDIFDTGESEEDAVKGFVSKITPDTGLVVTTAASNVTGRVLPVKEIYAHCQSIGIPLVVDAAQCAGTLDLKCGDVICAPGHKGLYGPQGTGVMVLRNSFPQLSPITYGGTGTASAEADSETMYPESFEAGTLNCPGIAGLKAGIEYLQVQTHNKELMLGEFLAQELKKISAVKVFWTKGEACLPVVSFAHESIPSERVSHILDKDYGIAVRGGLHCAPLCHEKLGTLAGGTVRASPGLFTSAQDIECLIFAVKRICQKGV